MNHLVDTNILCRLAEPGHAMHQAALDAVKLLAARGDQLHIVPQNLYEFWVVCTRPVSLNGMGRTAVEALSELRSLKSLFDLLDETPRVFQVWEQLVSTRPVLGRNAHDARLVAAMMVHGLTHILTFNAQDFRGYQGIIAVSPGGILQP
ncbi:hypothetical protein OJF2_41630 [Aquisphaera giovannonii]|uniref:PIN domain-containing protein n=1 Tax=Aquisphaera giovannonii TaxID=406548 RepID=A0A5B9W6L3_9BACT|nr:PIN domain-containing protein [Aquisphaera giovannonii]QEH35610.1 hypothetical protein OJF2_41630 [Aquisphaera giovannonii]